MSGLTVCVTGANGFVGSNLCRQLIAADHAVRALVRPTADRQSINGLAGLAIHIGDIRDPASLNAAFAGCDIVFHTAAYTADWGTWQTFLDSNVDGVRNVMDAARANGVRRVVHFSTVSVYGFPNARDITETRTWIAHPADPYITSKQQGETLALACHHADFEIVVLRPAGIYGHGDRITSLPLFNALEKRRFPYVDGGRWLMAPVYIDNLLQAALRAATSPAAAGQVYNVSDDGQTSWRQYIDTACRYLGCAPPPFSIPSRLAWPLACVLESAGHLLRLKNAPGLTRYRVRAVSGDHHYSSAKAKRELDYAPLIATEEGLRRTVEWYRGNCG